MGQTKTATFAELSYGSKSHHNLNNNNNNSSDSDVDVICDARKASSKSAMMASSSGNNKVIDFGVVKRVIVDVDIEDADNNNENVSDKNVVANGIKPSVKDDATIVEDGQQTTTQAAADSTSQTEEEYSYFGFIKVQAKLKWLNIVGIIVIHSMFLYVFTQDAFMPSIYTYLWGKFNLHIIFFAKTSKFFTLKKKLNPKPLPIEFFFL